MYSVDTRLKPRANYQKTLVDGVERCIQGMNLQTLVPEPEVQGLAETGALFFGNPPALIEMPLERPAHLERLVRKFDPAVRDAQNRQLGVRGEKRIYHFERARLLRAGCECRATEGVSHCAAA